MHLQDVILSTFLALGLGAGGVAMAVFANDWVTVNTGARQIRDALAASAVSQAIYVSVHVTMLLTVEYCNAEIVAEFIANDYMICAYMHKTLAWNN